MLRIDLAKAFDSVELIFLMDLFVDYWLSEDLD
jgi:hypothetical protein